MSFIINANRTDSQNYEDVVELQKLFVSKREEICKKGELLISPAHDYTMGVLENELEKERKVGGLKFNFFLLV